MIIIVMIININHHYELSLSIIIILGADLSDEELRLKAREEMMQQMEQQLIKEGRD